MKRGTPGFRGERLKEARDVRGLSAPSLGELANVSPQAIYQYESDRSSPSPEVVHRIATATNLPEAFFLLPPRSRDHGAIFYRSMAAATKGARRRAERRFSWFQDIVGYLSEYVAFPEPNLPSLDLPDDPLLISDNEIEEAADYVRKEWRMGDGPIANVVLLLENQGVLVARDRLGAETLDGLSAQSASLDWPFVFIGTDKGSPARWRFDAAHELGHILLHSHLDPATLNRPELFAKVEQQAHRFAAALLLPMASFGDELVAVNLDAFQALKPKWKVSIAMMLTRARHAGFVSDDAYRRLWIALSRKKWRTVEPFDDIMEIEEPRLARRAFELILENGAQTPADITTRLALPPADIETLCALPKGFLENYARVALRSRPSDPRREDSGASAQILPFPRRPVSGP